MPAEKPSPEGWPESLRLGERLPEQHLYTDCVKSAALRQIRKWLPNLSVVVATSISWQVFHGGVTLSLAGEDIGGAATGVALYQVQKAVVRRIRSHRAATSVQGHAAGACDEAGTE